MELEETLGYQIGQKRMQLKLSEPALADEINELRKEDKYSYKDVLDWESNSVVPNEEVLIALVTILITSNDKVEDKEGTAKRFMQAAAATEDALNRDRSVSKEDNFGRMLAELRIENGKSEADLAKALSGLLRRTFTADEIWLIEKGSAKDGELFRAMVSYFVDKEVLEEPEARRMRLRYENENPEEIKVTVRGANTLYEAHRQLVELCDFDLSRSRNLEHVVKTASWPSTYEKINREITRRGGEKQKDRAALLERVNTYRDEVYEMAGQLSGMSLQLFGMVNQQPSDNHARRGLVAALNSLKNSPYQHLSDTGFYPTPESLKVALDEYSASFEGSAARKEQLIRDIVSYWGTLTSHIRGTRQQGRAVA